MTARLASLATFLAEARKAYTAGLAAGVGVYAALASSGANLDPRFEIAAALGAGLFAAALVFFVKNQPPAPTAPAAPAVPPAA
jgi:hypothetical protein